MLKITADENIPFVREAFQTIGKVDTRSGRNIVRADLLETDILLVRSVTRVDEVLLKDTPIRFVASATAGFNHIDLDYLASRSIGFARAPGSNAVSAAEYVLAAICLWSVENRTPLKGKSIGIIGVGNVGSRVRQLCERFGMSCVLNDPPVQEKLEQQGSIEAENFAPIEEALACDIVTLHVPLERGGKHPTLKLINAQRIDQLRPDTLFINASRGEAVEEASLLKRMQTSADLQLVLDVWENEPDINLEMLSYTLIGTPHIAGYSIDAKIRGTEMIYTAVCNYLDKAPIWSAAQIDFEKMAEKTGQSTSPYNLQNSLQPDKRRAVLEAYDILADDARLKRLLSDKQLDTSIYFDSLRKNYPIRREFSGLE